MNVQAVAEKTYNELMAEERIARKILAIHRLRINVKSLTCEAKIIRKEAKRCGPRHWWELELHRRGELRYEARMTHLCLAYVRGMPYKRVEQKTNSPLGDHGLKRMKQKISKLWGHKQDEGIQAWFEQS